MNKRLKVTLKILDNVASKYPETKKKKKIHRDFDREDLTVEEVFCLRF